MDLSAKAVLLVRGVKWEWVKTYDVPMMFQKFGEYMGVHIHFHVLFKMAPGLWPVAGISSFNALNHWRLVGYPAIGWPRSTSILHSQRDP